MASEGGQSSERRIRPNGHNVLAIPEEKDLRVMYGKLSPDERTWRCETTKVSSDLLDKSWELLRPIADGRWDKENCYKGLGLFIKGIYESQGYACLPPAMMPRMSDLMRVIQHNLCWVEAGGRRQQADDNPARYALRVAFNCVALLLITGLALGTEAGQQPQVQAENAELQEKALQMSAGCVDKLGGPGLHEGSLSREDAAVIARIATAGTPEAAQRVCSSAPHSLLALYMLQVLYDVDMRKVKWVLLYVATRCAKEAIARARTAGDAAAITSAGAAWLSHSASLAAIDPGSPLGSFMAAEARFSVQGGQPATLAAMRKAVKAAEAKGDDLLAWLAHLNVATILLNGGEGGRGFSEDAVMQCLDAAASQRSSVSRWGGTVMMDNRCRALKQDILSQLDESRVLDRKQREEAAGGGDPLPEGVLPYVRSAHAGRVLEPLAFEARECAGCHKFVHKAMQCGRCRQAWYCSRECQAVHWKAGGHKAECARLAAEAAAAKKGEEGGVQPKGAEEGKDS